MCLLLGTSLLLSRVKSGGMSGMSDGEGLQSVSCGPRRLARSCSWNPTSTALGLSENGCQMKEWLSVRLEELCA